MVLSIVLLFLYSLKLHFHSTYRIWSWCNILLHFYRCSLWRGECPQSHNRGFLKKEFCLKSDTLTPAWISSLSDCPANFKLDSPLDHRSQFLKINVSLFPSGLASLAPWLIHLLCCCSVASVVSNSVRPHRRQPSRLPSLGFSRQEHWSGLPFPSPVHESEKWKWSRSVVSDSWEPHGPQPTRLLRPWGFPARALEWGPPPSHIFTLVNIIARAKDT